MNTQIPCFIWYQLRLSLSHSFSTCIGCALPNRPLLPRNHSNVKNNQIFNFRDLARLRWCKVWRILLLDDTTNWWQLMMIHAQSLCSLCSPIARRLWIVITVWIFHVTHFESRSDILSERNRRTKQFLSFWHIALAFNTVGGMPAVLIVKKQIFWRCFHKQKYVVFVRWKSYEWRNKNVTFSPNPNPKMINCKIQTFDVRNAQYPVLSAHSQFFLLAMIHFIYEKTRLSIHMNIRFSEHLISISFPTKMFFVRFGWYNQVPIKSTAKCFESHSFIQLRSELIGVVRFVPFINLHVWLWIILSKNCGVQSILISFPRFEGNENNTVS